MTTTHDAPPAYEPLPEDADQWTAKIRRKLVRALPPDRMVPDRQPAYLSSWIYIFGALTMSALAVVIITGTLLALEGPAWWHLSTVGLFVNSLHLWSVELFFFFMVIHLWGKFFMAAWRGNRTLTWMTAVITFMASIGAGLTGYLSQTNFESQWIATQAKDGINAIGAGAFFNVLNFGQMLMWHIMILPLAVVALTVLHILLVRTKGIVPPFEIASPEGGVQADATAETTGGEG
jgi:quinol-cytochrome oxidoreductase complex cytochrome b subunit